MNVIVIILLGILIVALMVLLLVVLVLRSRKKRHFKRDVYISGGVNINTGQLSLDKNYFRGISMDSEETVYVGYRNRTGKQKKQVLQVAIANMNNGQVSNVQISDYITIGREQGEGIYHVPDDPMVARINSRIFVESGNLYIIDMNSRNKTFLNGFMVQDVVLCHSGDIITVGMTNLQIIFPVS